jgi:hypothetical protein
MSKHEGDLGHGEGATVEVRVLGPADVEARSFSFKKNQTVQEAARIAAEALGYAAATPTFQNDKGQVLDRAKNLAASGVKDGDVLELVDAGGGV